MRKNERYFSDIPIEFETGNIKKPEESFLNDFSKGGLSFNSKKPLKQDTILMIGIPLIHSVFKIESSVIWCKKVKGGFHIGVKFKDFNRKFQVEMIEQICCIEHYKKEVFAKEGRILSTKDAAFEWIDKFARDFRKLKEFSMRGDIRHITDIPIEYDIVKTLIHKKSYLNNISKGGLSFRSDNSLNYNTMILVQIPLINPVFKINAEVISCAHHENEFYIGVKFLEKDKRFKELIIDQICYIENFRKEILQKEGRIISGEEAFQTIVKEHTKDFPQIYGKT